jgi:hypothetical protein
MGFFSLLTTGRAVLLFIGHTAAHRVTEIGYKKAGFDIHFSIAFLDIRCPPLIDEPEF